MNRRIKKKKEKKSLMEDSFETVSDFPYKKRRIINMIWKDYHDSGYRILVRYKRKLLELIED